MRTYSRRELYALGETLGESVTTRKVGGGLILGGGGSGGGSAAPTQTTSTSYQTNIPEYAKPYVETMLGATQQQLFQGNPTGDGGFNITGFQPYKAYGGTYDAQGNQTSYDPTKSVAGFSPLQQQAQQGTANLQVPDQYNQAMGVTGAGIMNAAQLGASSNPYDFQQNVAGYMNPYMQQVLNPQMDELRRQYGITGTQQAAQATQAGAFGGSRDAIMAAENQRNLGMAQNQAIGQAYGNAFNAAQNQYNQNAGFQLQANQAAMQGANQLAGLGQQQLTAQQGILGLQNQMGAQQQAYNQQVINQAMQDYANAQQYPLMQLGTMSNMLRGLPMQATTTNQYVAAPNPITQGIGAAGAAASLYNATKAEGGIIKSMASGGIASYDVGGEVYADLEKMDPKELQQIAQHSDSPSMQKMARAILARSIPVQAASGGIIGFDEGTKGASVGDDAKKLQYESLQERAERNLQERGNIYSGRKPTAEQNAAWNASAPTTATTSAPVETRITPSIVTSPSGIRYRSDLEASGEGPNFWDRFKIQDPEAARAAMAKLHPGAPAFEPSAPRVTPTPTPAVSPNGITAVAPPAAVPTNPKEEAGKAAVAQLVSNVAPSGPKEPLPPGVKTPAEFAAQINKDPDYTPDVKKRLIERYTNGYKQFEQPTKPAYKQPGILGAATAGTLQNAAPKVTPDVLESEDLKKLKQQLTTDRDKQLAEANKSQDEILKEIRDREGPNVGLQNYRAEEMARRSNLADEARRQKDMRLAEFFSKWGTTPGATLVAGMTALKSSIPDMINDRKEARKLEKESDKVIFDLEQADRLEKRGQDDKAYARKTDAAKRAEEINKLLAQIEERQTTARVQHEGNVMHLQGQLATAAAHERTGKYAADVGQTNKDSAAYAKILDLERQTERDLDAARKNSMVAPHIAIIEKAKTDPKVDPKQLEMSKAIVDKELGERASRLQSIRAEKNRLGKVLGYTTADEPPPPPANRPLLSSFQK